MQLDHIAVAGATLAEAALAVETALGVAMQPGGNHIAFGTHNRLLGLADGIYLEAIAIDASASPPERPRWFDLDRFSGAARLTNWICATDDMAESLGRMDPRAGEPMDLQRGDMTWRMAVPANGVLPFDNLHPALIQWTSPVHPCALLVPSGCALRRLVVSHPRAADLRAALHPHLDDARIVFESGAPDLLAEFDTPHGVRTLQ